MTDDLAALVARLAHALGKADPKHPLPMKAMRYLVDNDLLTGPWVRSAQFGATQQELAKFVAKVKDSKFQREQREGV